MMTTVRELLMEFGRHPDWTDADRLACCIKNVENRGLHAYFPHWQEFIAQAVADGRLIRDVR